MSLDAFRLVVVVDESLGLTGSAVGWLHAQGNESLGLTGSPLQVLDHACSNITQILSLTSPNTYALFAPGGPDRPPGARIGGV